MNESAKRLTGNGLLNEGYFFHSNEAVGIESIELPPVTGGSLLHQELQTVDEMDHGRVKKRYVRDDISITIKPSGQLFNRAAKRVMLLDISQNGMAIHAEGKLRVKTKLFVTFTFSDGAVFHIYARVVRPLKGEVFSYALQFDDSIGAFTKHLLKTELSRKWSGERGRGKLNYSP
jgi:hypothetical protein